MLPYGYTSIPEPNTWTDQWSWNAAGVPTVCTSAGGPEYDLYYHSTVENADRVNHEYIGGVAKWNYRVIQAVDEGVLPYDMSARGDQLIGKIQAGKLVRAGVTNRAATAFKQAAAQFRAAAWQWELRKAATPARKVDAVNDELVALQKTIQATFTSREQYDFPAYPHEAAVGDALYLTKAINAAKAGRAARAQQMLSWYVGINYYMDLFSPQVCRDDLVRHYPDYEHVTWGGMGTPPLVVDCIDEYLMLGEGDFDGALAGLRADRAAVQADLRERVADMTAALKQLTKRVKAL